MNSNRATWIVIGAVVVLVVIVGCVMAACNTTPNPNPSPTATQECIEADGEPCDEDPFDLDDSHKKKTTKKPVCVPTKRHKCK